jgi:hypothetical protein
MHVPPSTATQLLRKFADAGKSAADITAIDISDVYESFNSGTAPIDLSCARKAVADKAAQAPTDAPLGIIVETRCHPNLDPVVRQVLDQGINIQIIHGTNNGEFVASCFGAEIASGRVKTTQLDYETLGREEYNGLLLSKEFWDMLHGRGKILIFQTDALLCSKSKYRLRDFLEFDYIGSAWGRARRRGIVVDGGNGGLSLRDWQLSVECLDRFPPNTWWGGGEDTYFCFHINLIGGRVALPEESARFGSQFWFTENSFGAHKVGSMGFISRTLFLSWCPEGRTLLPPDAAVPEYYLGAVLTSLGLARTVTRIYRTLCKGSI